jgi:hypothetical protein
MTTEAFKGTGLWRMQSVLSTRNRDDWFDTLETIAKGEDVEFLLTKTLTGYSTIKDSIRTETPGDDWVADHNEA